MAQFEVFEDGAGQWRYRLRADNGEVVCQSEGYASEDNARRGTVDLATAALTAQNVEVKRA